MNELEQHSLNDCELCGGSGWEVVGESTDSRARRCICYRELQSRLLLQAACIPGRYEHCDFASFGTLQKNPGLARAKSISVSFAEEYPGGSPGSGLLFVGPCGVGKTHLAIAIIEFLSKQKGVACLFQDFRDLLQEIRGTFDPVSQSSEHQVLKPVLETEVLVLDDIGASKPTRWVQETLSHVINIRYNEKRTTIFTSNYLDSAPKAGDESLEERIGTRLRSRLYEMCRVVTIDGDDFRRTIKHAAIE